MIGPTMTAIIICVYYVALIYPMRIFYRVTYAFLLDEFEGHLPRDRVILMRSVNMINLIALLWPVTLWVVFYQAARFFWKCPPKEGE